MTCEVSQPVMMLLRGFEKIRNFNASSFKSHERSISVGGVNIPPGNA